MTVVDVSRESSTPETWTGKYFPEHTPAPIALHGGVSMGLNPNCDDAKVKFVLNLMSFHSGTLGSNLFSL